MTTNSDFELSNEHRSAALALAERTVEYGARHGEPLELKDSIVEIFPEGERATFVSVYVEQKLNGCMGKLRAARPLPADIVYNAYGAAFRDHRFPPVEPRQLEETEVQISVLAPPEPVPVEAESELWNYVEPGRHGLLLQTEDHRGTFLPSVWKKCPDRETFLTHLKKKAGLPPDSWPDELRVFRYTADRFDRESLRAD